MPGRSNLNADCVDTEQIFDACITAAKLDPSLVTPAASIPAGSITGAMLAAGLLTNGTRCGMAYAEVGIAAGTKPIGTVPGGSLITDVIAFVRTAFDGDTAITVGRTAAQTAIFTSLTLTPINTVTGETASAYGTDLFSTVKKTKWVANDTIYNAYVTSTTGTVGALDVYIFYIRGVMSG